ncbi:MAG: fumarylacetoacetate hydrolase family protein [Spirochaetes bacterium]|nr:fumarylacetoacetate hydrolase family protein [Spirochaetota bacterium]
MKLARVIYEGRESYARIEGSSLVILDGKPGEGFSPAGKTIDLAQARFLAPCRPSKALCIGLNYRDHAEEFGLAIPSSPVVFIKPATTLLEPFGNIVWPELSKRVEYEAELVVVIGRLAKNLKASEALDYVLGYTCGNDVTARDLQPKEGQWTVAKSFDGFMPLGPWIETELDPSDLEISSFLNGQRKQHSRTSNLIFSVPELLSYLSRVMTLEPGDVIMTGTPSGVGPMARGDEIAVEIEGIGRLVNKLA